MPIQHAVLALLAEGDSYGYELRAEFERAVGPQWGELNIGHLYQVLDRLVRDGMVTRREVAQPVKPDRVVYGITENGRGELQHWLGAPRREADTATTSFSRSPRPHVLAAQSSSSFCAPSGPPI